MKGRTTLGLAVLLSVGCFAHSSHSPESDLSDALRCPADKITAGQVSGNLWWAACSANEKRTSYTCRYGESTGYDGFCKMDEYSETLKTDSMIDSIPYKAGTSLDFYPNGRLKTGTLAADTTIGGVTYKAGSELHFRDNGRFIGVKNADGTCCSLVTAHTQ